MRRLAVVVKFVAIACFVVGSCLCVQNWLSSPTILPQPVVVSKFKPPVPPPRALAPVLPSAAPVPAAVIPPVIQPAEDAVPDWLSIPSIGIDESIATMGLTPQGEIEPPPGQTIWYDGSVKPGQPGVAAIAGHVQWGSTPDNFWRLNELSNGSLFSVRYSDGTVLDFTVTSSRSELKTDVQNDPEVWGGSETSVVVLVTCDKNSPIVKHYYTNNWLVFAKRA